MDSASLNQGLTDPLFSGAASKFTYKTPHEQIVGELVEKHS